MTKNQNPRRLLALPLAAAIVALVAPGAAGAGGGPPVPGGSYSGVVGPLGSPNKELRYATTVSRGATTVFATKTNGGELRGSGTIDGTWQVPAVTWEGDGGGLSANGRTLVLLHPSFALRPDETKFLVLDARNFEVRDRIFLEGLASFDAISPDGKLIYFVDYAGNNALDYDVRAYDFDAGKLLPGEIVNPEEPDEQMSGQPYSRAMSPDGRWAYTLYGGGEETFIHALDTEGATAVCVDLAQFNPNKAFNLDLAVAATGGAISVARRGGRSNGRPGDVRGLAGIRGAASGPHRRRPRCPASRTGRRLGHARWIWAADLQSPGAPAHGGRRARTSLCGCANERD